MLNDVFPVGKTSGFTVDTARGVAGPIARHRRIDGAQPADRDLVSGRSGTSPAPTPSGQRRAPAHFPLVVFAPGFDSNPDTYQPFLHAIAAQGFIVAAPVFPIEASIAGAAPASRSNTEILNQMYDMSAVITQMITYARSPGNFLGGAMSQTQIGIIGHSDGAMTVAGMTMSTSYNDPRIKAAVVMNGAGPIGLTWNDRKVVPTMIEQATGDPYNNPANSQWLFNHVAGSRDYLTVAGPYHIWPLVGNDEVSDLVRRSVITNLDLTLKSPGWPTWWAMVAAANTPGFTSLKFAT